MVSLHSTYVPIAASSAAIGYVVYRICAHRARRDTGKLHAEVCTERESLRCVIEALPDQLESARLAVVRAAGRSGPEATQHWLGGKKVDLGEEKLLGSQLPAEEIDDTDRSGMASDIKLAEILALSIRANRLAHKYR